MVTGPNKNKELIRGWIAFANGGFLGSFDQFIADDYIGHLGATNMNCSEFECLEREFCVAFPDAQHFIDDLIVEKDLVVLRSTARATHRGEFQGVARTEKSVESTAIVIYRIQDGKIVESWGEVDFLRLMRQLRSAQPAV